MLDSKYKRINPNTNKPFKSGDEREDGFLFHGYTKPIKKDGFYTEKWISKETRKNQIELRKRNRKKWNPVFNPKIHKRRLNPKTGKEFIRGEQDENGKYFYGYKSFVDSKNYALEQWLELENYLRQSLRKNLYKIKDRVKKKHIPFNIDLDYLISIYPDPPKCPALGIYIFPGGGYKEKDMSPSLDRIIPKKGYVKGNVRWVSLKANIIMNEFEADDILKVGNWLKKQNLKRK